ncbi:RHS repeat-associated protein [Pseudomonas lini]|uniref:RHS repeat-associated core domain-containing protein n=1 Tax=Pseudomonas lini TaxID=163011 RepID=UPI00277FC5BC|nr:RHS repeat-associated core domain-containing protein [Pseudomonas lini]MDQ0126976.1 RHS repeat-associated protein [Pseudomonas lini]
MPASTRETFLGRYHYDPLDRLIDCALFDQETIQRYYCKTRLSTEIQGAVQRTIVQHDDLLLAQQQREGDKVAAKLLATDPQRSVLNALDATRPNALAYSPYGHRPRENGLLSLLGFNGERLDPVTGHYHLGNGYRQFNPVLMRFNSPDSWSPFGEGGLNAYAYAEGNPVLGTDATGHAFTRLFGKNWWKGFKNRIGVRTPSKFDIKKSSSKHSDTIKSPISVQSTSSKPRQVNALDDAKEFDWNALSPAEIELNFKQTVSRPVNTEQLKLPFFRAKLDTPDKTLANLESARTNTSRRLDSNPGHEKRLVMLHYINSDIAKLKKQMSQVRDPNSPITI